MRRCAARPYEGNENYIFVSYCHRDRASVFPIIEHLARDGYRVWYDEGIDPGAEWPEMIANHLNSCSVCIAFISENSLNSHNCRREINFALLKKKCFISVVLEPVQMSLGMEMQLSSSQSIFKFTLESDAQFFRKLYEAKELQKCLGEPNRSVRISDASEYDEGSRDGISAHFSDRWFAKGDEKYVFSAFGNEIKDSSRITYERKDNKNSAGMQEFREASSDSCSENTIGIDLTENVTVFADEKDFHSLVRVKTNEIIPISKGVFVIGRSASSADYVIEDNQSISRVHAIFNVSGGMCTISDNRSLNKTYLNDQELIPDEKYPLQHDDRIKLYNEIFVYQKNI